MHKQIDVIYENGLLRPLEPLPAHFREHQRFTITIDTPETLEARLDAACVAAAQRDADPTVSLDDVRSILARVSGTLAEAVALEREEG